MRSWLASGIVVIALALSVSAEAAGRRGIGIGVFSGYQSYSMSDINDRLIAPSPLLPGATVDIGGGLGLGAGVRWTPSYRSAVAVDVSRLLASTDGTGSMLGEPYEWHLEVPANAVMATIAYQLVGRSARAGLAGGAGYYWVDGEVVTVSSTNRVTSRLRGSGLGVHALITGEVPLADGVCMEGGCGYRWAKTSDVELENAMRDDRFESHIDWSGAFARLGVVFYLAK